MHEKRVANAATANQSENEEGGMNFAIVRLGESSRSDRFANRAKFEDVKDNQSDVNGEAGTRRMPMIPQQSQSP